MTQAIILPYQCTGTAGPVGNGNTVHVTIFNRMYTQHDRQLTSYCRHSVRPSVALFIVALRVGPVGVNCAVVFIDGNFIPIH